MKSIRDYAENVEYAEPRRSKGTWHRPHDDAKFKENWNKIDWSRK